jgi:hypothetical protein
MKPDQMTRGEVLAAVMKNYRRFYMRKSFLGYPWIRDRFKRKYMLGCLRAFLKSSLERRFYDLGRVGFFGQSDVDFKFDPDRVLTAEQLVQIETDRPRVGSMYNGEPRSMRSQEGATRPYAAGRHSHVAPAPVATAEVSPGVAPHLVLGEERIDEFLDPRGFARQRARAKRQAMSLTELREQDTGQEIHP